MKSNKREAAINVSLSILSIVLILVALEVGLQLAPAEPQIGIECTDGQISSFDSTIGVQINPNRQCKQTFQKTEEKIRTVNVTTNNEGRRITPQTGTDTVWVFGDSFTWGSTVNDTETYPYLLDKWNADTKFYNYGVGGFGTDQEFLKYQRIVSNSSNTQPRAVLIGYYVGNDGRDNMKVGSSPRFSIEDGELNLTHKPERNTQGGSFNTGPIQQLQNWLRGNTKSYPFIANKISNTLYKMGLAGQITPNYVPPSGERLDEELQLTQAILDKWVAKNNKRGIDTYIMIIPERVEIYPNNPNQFAGREPSSYFNAQRSMIKNEYKNDSNVTVIDPKEELRSKSNSTRVYHSINGHWSKHGQRVAAKDINRSI